MLRRDPLLVRLERDTPYVNDPLDAFRLWMLRGTLIHRGLLRKAPNMWIELPVSVPVGDLTLYSTLDVLDFRGARSSIRDLKTQKPWAVEKKQKQSREELLADRYVQDSLFQVNCYRTVLHLATGIEVDDLYLEFFEPVGMSTVQLQVPTRTFEDVMSEVKPLMQGLYTAFTAPDYAAIGHTDGAHISVKNSGVYYKWKELTSKQ